MEPEDEGGLLEAVVDLASQVEHAADVDKHFGTTDDVGSSLCKNNHKNSEPIDSSIGESELYAIETIQHCC